MNYILSISFANEAVATKSYENLSETSGDEQIIVLDNHYPLNRKNFLRDLCERLRFHYIDAGYNMGLYDGWSHLLHQLPPDCQSVILHDGDHFLLREGWTKAIFDVLEDERVGTCIVSNEINQRELRERGYTIEHIEGQEVMVSQQAICCTVGGWNVDFLKSIGGITAPNKYYGGNEIHMWDHYCQQGKKFVVLQWFTEELGNMKALHDWQYEEYKLLYAHRGLKMSFDDFLKTKPERQGVDNLIKQIFG